MGAHRPTVAFPSSGVTTQRWRRQRRRAALARGAARPRLCRCGPARNRTGPGHNDTAAAGRRGLRTQAAARGASRLRRAEADADEQRDAAAEGAAASANARASCARRERSIGNLTVKPVVSFGRLHPRRRRRDGRRDDADSSFGSRARGLRALAATCCRRCAWAGARRQLEECEVLEVSHRPG